VILPIIKPLVSLTAARVSHLSRLRITHPTALIMALGPLLGLPSRIWGPSPKAKDYTSVMAGPLLVCIFLFVFGGRGEATDIAIDSRAPPQ
jgi:hypothetical protein